MQACEAATSIAEQS